MKKVAFQAGCREAGKHHRQALSCLVQAACESVWLVQRIDALLEAVEVEEVAFQAGCQAAELRAVLASALGQPQRKLANMHSRIHKHLGATAPKPAAEVRPRMSPCNLL